MISLQTLQQIAGMKPNDTINVPGFGDLNKEQYIERMLANTLGIGNLEWNYLSK